MRQKRRRGTSTNTTSDPCCSSPLCGPSRCAPSALTYPLRQHCPTIAPSHPRWVPPSLTSDHGGVVRREAAARLAAEAQVGTHTEDVLEAAEAAIEQASHRL
jgi:hypothetical protein